MGEIVFWTIVRTAVLIPLLWVMEGYLDFRFGWVVGLFAVYGVVIHPAIIHYRLFISKNKEIIESTLCSTCKHFDESAVLCMLHDKHPSKIFLPCGGVDWELDSSNVNRSDIYRTE